MPTRLNQIVAVVKALKAESTKTLSDVHHRKLKDALLIGHHRRYTPLRDDATLADKKPDEVKLVQATVPSAIQEVIGALSPLLDAVLTNDVGNTLASASVVVGEQPLLTNVPVTFLLFLEKQAGDLEELILKLPTLDTAEDWIPDPDSEGGFGYKTKGVDSVTTTKVTKGVELSPATKEHPAQVHVVNVDEVIGTWSTVKKSGAIRLADRNAALARVRNLKAAIRVAREGANIIEIEQKKCGDAVLNYIFGDLVTKQG